MRTFTGSSAFVVVITGAVRTAFLAGKLRGAQVHDARIHAICQANGVRELWSADRDFSRFRGLTIVNPCLD